MGAFLSQKIRRLWQISPVATVFAGLVIGYCLWVLVWGGSHLLWPAWRVSHLPVMNAADVRAAAPGDAVLVTGQLDGDPAAHGFVLYTLERWEITTSPDSANKPYGHWVDAPGHVPDLYLLGNGQPLRLQSNPDVTLLGPVRLETYAPGSEHPLPVGAVYLAEGTLRYRGLLQGDTVTALGYKTEANGIWPTHLFQGTPDAFREWLWRSTKNLFLATLFMLIVAPPLTYVLTAIFMGKWRALLGRE